MIKLRLDVDYAYPSRMKSFLYTALNRKTKAGYLKNSKIIARMINESPREVRAYWFFTPYTIPDGELLELLTPDKHEIALHVATDPYGELENLEKATGRKVKFYTVHGTARLLARLIWKRGLREARAPIPEGFPLQSFYEFPTIGFDLVCYDHPPLEAIEIGEKSLAEGKVLHVHPEWLFQQGTINHRGPFYVPLRRILQVDTEFETLVTRKKGFAKIGKYVTTKEYEQDMLPTERFLEKLSERGFDVYTFLERNWCCLVTQPSKSWVGTEDNIALLKVTSYAEWLEQVGKKTRNMIRKAEKSDVRTEVAAPDDKLVEGIWKIYNETPIRQNRTFPHYGQSLETVKALIAAGENRTYIAAYLHDEMVGFIELVHGDKIAIISQILTLQKHADKAIGNILVAKAVEVCAAKQCGWIMYGRMGNHPSLDNFKKNNGFAKHALTRYYVSVTRRGRIILSLGLQREIKDILPERIKFSLIPVYNWFSRRKTQA